MQLSAPYRYSSSRTLRGLDRDAGATSTIAVEVHSHRDEGFTERLNSDFGREPGI